MKNLAVIPARGGSKRIPGKNIKHFLGKPIIAYSIQAALDSGLFDEVMVSTDSEEIKLIAEKFGATVPFLRSEKNSDDHATISNVMSEVIAYHDEKKIHFDNICCIFSTAPFATPTKLNEAFEKLYAGDFISIVPIQKFSYPILRSLKINNKQQLEMNWQEHAKTRSQDLEEAFHDAGQFYWAKMEAYRKELKFFSSKTGFIELKAQEAQDIDNEDDWRMAELKYKFLIQANSQPKQSLSQERSKNGLDLKQNMAIENSIVLKKELTISFKGSRDYIYASDIFSLIASELEQFGLKVIEKIDFSVHSFSKKGIEFVLYKDQIETPDSENIAQIKFMANGINYFGIVKSTETDISERTEYTEQEIFDNTEIDEVNNSIRLINNFDNYGNLDVFTSMNKRLLHETKPDIKGKWLSVRLQLKNMNDLFDKRENYRIELKKIFSNKYAKSSLFNNDKPIGNLFFSLIKQN